MRDIKPASNFRGWGLIFQDEFVPAEEVMRRMEEELP
jgi:hypothetical protein